MKRPYNAFLAICLAVAAVGGTASAATGFESGSPTAPAALPGAWHDGHDGGGFRHLLGQLDLTPEQQQQIQTIFAQAQPQLQSLRERGRANREQLFVTPPTDPKYAGLLATAKSNAGGAIQLMSDLWTQVYAILTPDQRAKIPGIFAREKAGSDARRQTSKDRGPPSSP